MSVLNNDILEKIVTHSENSIFYYQKTDLSLICSTCFEGYVLKW